MNDNAKLRQIEYQNKSKQDAYTLVVCMIIVYVLGLNFHIYQWVTAWLDYFGFAWLNEAIAALLFASVGFFLYAYRRKKEIAYEIALRENLELDYKNYRAQIHKVFDATNERILQMDANLRVTWASSSVHNVYDNAIGAEAYKVMNPNEEFVPHETIYTRAMEIGLVQKEIKYSPATENAPEAYYEHIVVPIKDTDANVVGAITAARNITEKMQVEESRSRLTSMVESSDDAIFVVSLDGNIHSWNSSAEKIFGYSAGQVVGQPITILDHLIDFETLALIPQALEFNTKETIQHVDCTKVNRPDRDLYISLTMYPFVDETGKTLGFSSIARDITTAVKGEEALRESESRFRQLSNTIQDAFWLIDWDTQKMLYYSPAYPKIWGRTPNPEKFIINEWADWVHPEDRDRFVNSSKNIVKNNGMVEEFRVVLPNGEERWVRDRAYPIYDENGLVKRVAGIAQDITENKIAEQALKESEFRFKELFQNMSSGVAVYEAINDGADFLVRDFNKAGELIEKINRANILGKSVSNFIDRNENSTFMENLKRVWITGEPLNYQFTFYANGEIKGWRQNNHYKLPSGEIVSIFDDITDKITQDEALRESEERYRTFVQNFKGIAFRWLSDGTPIFMHGSVYEITGYENTTFVDGDKVWTDIVHPDDVVALKKHLLLINSVPHYETEIAYRIIRSDGELRWVNESLQNLCDTESNIIYVQATLYDITQKKIFEDELRASRAQLRNLALHLDSVREEERKQIAFEIHDELGYALTAVKLDLAWLVKKIDVSKDNLELRTKEMSDLIETTIQKVRTISANLRPSILDHFGLSAAIDWQAKEFQRRTAVRCRVTINPKEGKVKESLSILIFRIYQEALTNIARYAKASRVDVNFEKSDEFITLRVADNGIGISEEKINDRNSFGLLGIREKAKSMGGEVIISRLDEGGTAVSLKVPLNEPATENVL